MKANTKVIGNSIIYTFNTLAISALSFLLLPIYTRFLSTTDYGVQSLINRFSNVATYIISLCLYSAITRFYTDYKDDQKATAELFGTVSIFTLVFGSLFITLCIAFRNTLSISVFKDAEFFPVVLLGLISMLFSSEYTIYQRILQAQQLSIKSAITGLVYFFLHLLLALYFVAYRRLGVIGVFTANCLTNTIMTMYMVYDLHRKKLIVLKINFKLLKALLKYSIPLIPHNVTAQIFQLVSNILISRYNSISYVGLFSLASQISSATDTASTGFNQAYLPWFFDTLTQRETEYKNKIKSMTYIIIWILGIVFLCVGLFSQELILLLSNEGYHEAWKVVPLLVLGFIFKVPYYFYISVLFYYKEASKYIFISTLTATITGLITSPFLIEQYGMYGAVIANLLYILVQVIGIVLISTRFESVGLSINGILLRVVIISSTLIIGVLPSYWIWPDTINIYNIIFKIGVIMVYLFIVYINNRDSIKGALKIFRRGK